MTSGVAVPRRFTYRALTAIRPFCGSMTRAVPELSYRHSTASGDGHRSLSCAVQTYQRKKRLARVGACELEVEEEIAEEDEQLFVSHTVA